MSPTGAAQGGDAPSQVVFRLPSTAYLVVLFLAFGTVPLAFTAASFTFDGNGNSQSAPGVISWQIALLVIPVLAYLFVRRTATIVDGSGVVVRAPFGSRALSWDDIRGLSVTGRNVYAVVGAGAVRLPCVGVPNLAQIARASNGRLPAVADPRPKYAPQRRRR